tara:strand:+ start:395 stop:556 length:162 start_codon:yes stop_codon:yes gene_type:complete
METNTINQKPDPTIFIDDSADQEKFDRAEERYLKKCIEMDEGQPNDNDSGWDY